MADIWARHSGHWIHLDHAELVADAIREVVAAVRSPVRMEASAQRSNNRQAF